jgi:leader peptidase (prepilin peptidase)/N-methyltransferase
MVGGFLGFLIGAVVGVGVLLVRRGGRKYRYPYGPWMILGAWIGVVWGQDIWSGYIDTFTGT